VECFIQIEYRDKNNKFHVTNLFGCCGNFMLRYRIFFFFFFWDALLSLNQYYALMHSLFSRIILTRNVMYNMTSSAARNISTLLTSRRNWYVTTDISIIESNLCTVRTYFQIRPFNIANHVFDSPTQSR
jgi:hypothetical protein